MEIFTTQTKFGKTTALFYFLERKMSTMCANFLQLYHRTTLSEKSKEVEYKIQCKLYDVV